MKRPFILAVLCTTLASFCVKAQYNTAASYPFFAESKPYSYVSGGTDVTTSLAGDESMVSVPIGFTFRYCGANYTNVVASSNGWMSFINPTNPGGHWYPNNVNVSHLSNIVPALLPFWDNLVGGTSASASYITTGTAPNRVFTFEWKNWGYYEGSVDNSLSFQVLLNENGGNYTMEYRYKRETNAAPASGASLGATIGIVKTIADLKTLNSASATPTASSSSYTTNITSQPATDQSYYWGCPVNISSQPANKIVCATDNATFSVSSSNATTFHWQVNSGSGFTDLTDNSMYAGTGSNTLEITGATSGMNGYLYRCTVGTTDCSISSSQALLTVSTTATAITAQPASTDAFCQGTGTTISVTANGGGLKYQWQVDNGSGYADLSNTSVYSNVQTSTLGITNAPMSISGYRYRCVVTGVCAPLSINSNECTITVYSLPTIAGQPVDRIVCATDNTSFNVTSPNASGYQWQVNTGSGFANVSNGSIYAGATTNTLSLSGVTASMNSYKYRCLLSNTNCDIQSNEVTLTVSNTSTSITTQPPLTSAVCENANKTLSLVAAGGDLRYQWQVNDGTGYVNMTNTAPYSGVTTNQLTITAATMALTGYKYRCVVSGVCSPASVSSSECELTVNALPVGVDDPANSAICAGANTSFNATATGAATYRWQVNTGSGYTDVVADAYHSNVTTNTIAITGATASMNNNKYRMVSISAAGCETNSARATLTVNTAPVITTQPTSKSACDTKPVTFSVTSTGTGITYQWQENTGSGFANIVDAGIYSNATTATLNISAVSAAMNGYEYRCNITGTCTPAATSNTVTLTVNPLPVMTVAPTDQTVCAGNNAQFTATATGANTYVWQLNSGSGFADLTNTAPYSNTTTTSMDITTVTVGMNSYKYRMVAISAAGCKTNSAQANLAISTAPVITAEPTDKVICDGNAVNITTTVTGSSLTYQWQENSGAGFANIANGGIYSGATTNTLAISAAGTSMNGYAYRCLITGSCSPNANTNVVYLTVNPRPVLTSSPSGVTICVGNNTSFSATATGAATYKWQLDAGSGYADLANNSTYNDVTTNTLSVSSVTAGMNNYRYRIVIESNTGCPTTSAGALLTVNTLPAVTTHPTNKTICENDAASFSIAASGSALTYQWQVDDGSGFTNLSNGGVYSNVTTNMLDINGAPASMNNYEYRCVVSGACSPVAESNKARLTVNTSPVIITQPHDSTVCAGIAATFTVQATGSGLTYQWQERSGSLFVDLANNGNYTGTNTNTLKISNTTVQQNGYHYRCMVGGVCPPDVLSNPVTLTVNAFTSITQDPPANSITCELTDLDLKIKTNGSNLVYQWQMNTGSGYVNVTNGPMYTGANTDILTIVAPPSVIDGYQFICKVDGVCGGQDVSTPTTVKVNRVPKVETDPVDSTVDEFTPATFSITATGTALAYQWQVNDGVAPWTDLFDNAAYKGTKTNTLLVKGTFFSKDGYQYRCIVTGACPADSSEAAVLTVIQPPNSVGSTEKANGGFKLYPNPVTGSQLILKANHKIDGVLTINITDQLGRNISEISTRMDQEQQISLDASVLAAGMYYVKIQDIGGEQVSTLRFVKQ